MRELKFRAWEHETNMGKPGNMSYDQEFCMSQILHNDGIEIMQFTGLKDKLGKEIYEGDIVKSTYFVRGPGYKPLRRESNVRVVEWGENEDFCDKLVVGFIISNVDTADLEWEVIGNIYENPELLE